METSLGSGDNFLIESTNYVTLQESLSLTTEKGSIFLNVRVEADFHTIPEEYHEVFLNMMTSKYYGRVSFGDNPFSQCLPPKKVRWWQFWKQVK